MYGALGNISFESTSKRSNATVENDQDEMYFKGVGLKRQKQMMHSKMSGQFQDLDLAVWQAHPSFIPCCLKCSDSVHGMPLLLKGAVLRSFGLLHSSCDFNF
jgi:hypothetical protein